MDAIMKSEIFFFISAIAVIGLSLLFAIISVYLIRTFKNIDEISKDSKEEAKLIKEDIADLRTSIRTEGWKLKNLLNFFNKLK
ncbi:hypothetical protein L6278_02290, partial [Candidatus Parcubacteria bacterium]|nr:hypothetical protein [Candidatus Parcubacteria bacterium]